MVLAWSVYNIYIVFMVYCVGRDNSCILILNSKTLFIYVTIHRLAVFGNLTKMMCMNKLNV